MSDNETKDVAEPSPAMRGSGLRMYRAVFDGRGNGPDDVFLFASYGQAKAMLGERPGVVQEVIVVPSPWVDGIIGAWAGLKLFGHHEGPCDNDEACETCGSRLRGCSIHMEAVNKRMTEMADRIEQLQEQIDRVQ
jgi:hypothetical protein